MRCLRSSAGDRAPPGATLNTKAAGPQPVPTDGRCLVRGQGATLRRMRGHLLGHFKEGKAGFSPSPPPPAACPVRVAGYSPIRHWLYIRAGPRATLR